MIIAAVERAGPGRGAVRADQPLAILREDTYSILRDPAPGAHAVTAWLPAIPTCR